GGGGDGNGARCGGGAAVGRCHLQLDVDSLTQIQRVESLDPNCGGAAVAAGDDLHLVPGVVDRGGTIQVALVRGWRSGYHLPGHVGVPGVEPICAVRVAAAFGEQVTKSAGLVPEGELGAVDAVAFELGDVAHEGPGYADLLRVGILGDIDRQDAQLQVIENRAHFLHVALNLVVADQLVPLQDIRDSIGLLGELQELTHLRDVVGEAGALDDRIRPEEFAQQVVAELPELFERSVLLQPGLVRLVPGCPGDDVGGARFLHVGDDVADDVLPRLAVLCALPGELVGPARVVVDNPDDNSRVVPGRRLPP